MPPSSVSSATLSSSDGPSQTGPSPAVDTKDAGVDACHVGVVTDPDCLGPCEPGTTVTLEGIVWNETENGITAAMLILSLSLSLCFSLSITTIFPGGPGLAAVLGTITKLYI